MKKVMLLLVLCFMGCEPEENVLYFSGDPNAQITIDPNLLPKWGETTIFCEIDTETAGLEFISDDNFEFVLATESNLTWDTGTITLADYDYSGDIYFSGDDGSEVLFLWKDGKFDVIWDPNKCTEQANMFLDCMEPYLNPHINEKAKELAGISGQEASCIPRFFRDPKTNHRICSKHGDLEPPPAALGEVTMDMNSIAICGTEYCTKCYWETQVKLLNTHIIGVAEDD